MQENKCENERKERQKGKEDKHKSEIEETKYYLINESRNCDI